MSCRDSTLFLTMVQLLCLSLTWKAEPGQPGIAIACVWTTATLQFLICNFVSTGLDLVQGKTTHFLMNNMLITVSRSKLSTTPYMCWVTF